MFEVLREVRFDGIFCVEFPVLEDTGPFEACVCDLRRLFGEGRRGRGGPRGPEAREDETRDDPERLRLF